MKNNEIDSSAEYSEATSDSHSDIGFIFIIVCMLLVAAIGTAGFIFPAPSKWNLTEDCEILEGIIIEKRSKRIACLDDLCYAEYSIIVEDSENSENSTVYVSPYYYTTVSEGDYYNNFVC